VFGVCFCMSDQNSETPSPIWLKSWLGNSVEPRECSSSLTMLSSKVDFYRKRILKYRIISFLRKSGSNTNLASVAKICIYKDTVYDLYYVLYFFKTRIANKQCLKFQANRRLRCWRFILGCGWTIYFNCVLTF